MKKGHSPLKNSDICTEIVILFGDNVSEGLSQSNKIMIKNVTK